MREMHWDLVKPREKHLPKRLVMHWEKVMLKVKHWERRLPRQTEKPKDWHWEKVMPRDLHWVRQMAMHSVRGLPKVTHFLMHWGMRSVMVRQMEKQKAKRMGKRMAKPKAKRKDWDLQRVRRSVIKRAMRKGMAKPVGVALPERLVMHWVTARRKERRLSRRWEKPRVRGRLTEILTGKHVLKHSETHLLKPTVTRLVTVKPKVMRSPKHLGRPMAMD